MLLSMLPGGAKLVTCHQSNQTLLEPLLCQNKPGITVANKTTIHVSPVTLVPSAPRLNASSPSPTGVTSYSLVVPSLDSTAQTLVDVHTTGGLAASDISVNNSAACRFHSEAIAAETGAAVFTYDCTGLAIGKTAVHFTSSKTCSLPQTVVFSVNRTYMPCTVCLDCITAMQVGCLLLA
jgi:hypothetical protein